MSTNEKPYQELRSARWFGAEDIRAFGHRSRAMQMGYDAEDWMGKPIGENNGGVEVYNDDVIRELDSPICGSGALVVLKGNLAPDGCVMKISALDPRFLKHTDPALVFDDYPSMKEAVDDEEIDATTDTVLILRNTGPQGGPGMPEWGMLPIPKKLVKQGIRDMLHISDARMSGTS